MNAAIPGTIKAAMLCLGTCMSPLEIRCAQVGPELAAGYPIIRISRP